jgi:tRNA (guanine-N7-)-methyltransferase
MPQSAVSASSLLYDLPSILDRIDPAALFAQPRPVEVELGCGDASFLVRYAAVRRDANFIGVERLLGRLRKLDRKGRRAGLDNVRGIRIESGYFLEYLFPRACAAAIHVYFPDPWPKRKHWKNRLINRQFPGLAARALAPGGIVYLRTDDAPYFDQMTSVFAAAREFRAVETPPALASILTDFEEGFVARGIATRRTAFEKA